MDKLSTLNVIRIEFKTLNDFMDFVVKYTGFIQDKSYDKILPRQILDFNKIAPCSLSDDVDDVTSAAWHSAHWDARTTPTVGYSQFLDKEPNPTGLFVFITEESYPPLAIVLRLALAEVSDPPYVVFNYMYARSDLCVYDDIVCSGRTHCLWWYEPRQVLGEVPLG